MVDTLALGASAFIGVEVRVLSQVPKRKTAPRAVFLYSEILAKPIFLLPTLTFLYVTD